MALIKTEALVLKNIPFHETSSIVHLYTKKHGKIPVIARGSRRLKSPFRSYLEPLNYLEVTYYYKQTRDIQILSNVDLIRSFFSDSSNVLESVYAMSVIECIDKFYREYEEDENAFSFTIAVLTYMEAHKNLLLETFIFFLLKMIDILGYKLNLKSCRVCNGQLEKPAFDRYTGQVVCKKCSNNKNQFMPISAGVVNYLRSLDKIELGEIILPSLSIGETGKECVNFLLSYISFHLGHPVKLKTFEILPDLT
jgi:DNA repair protein RecO (recombination protein O)